MRFLPSLLVAGALLAVSATPAKAWWWDYTPTVNNTAVVDVTGISKAKSGDNLIIGSGTNTIVTGVSSATVASQVSDINLTSLSDVNVNNTFDGTVFGMSKATSGDNEILVPQVKSFLPSPCNTCGVNYINSGVSMSSVTSLISGINVTGFGSQ